MATNGRSSAALHGTTATATEGRRLTRTEASGHSPQHAPGHFGSSTPNFQPAESPPSTAMSSPRACIVESRPCDCAEIAGFLANFRQILHLGGLATPGPASTPTRLDERSRSVGFGGTLTGERVLTNVAIHAPKIIRHMTTRPSAPG